MAGVLHIEGLRKAYGDVVALHGVDLDVARGEIVSLLGPNGAGKTTIVSIVAGLRRADAGVVEVDGLNALRRSAEVRWRIGLAPQDLGMYPVVSVRNNLLLFGRLAGLGNAELRSRIDEVAEALEITDLLDRQGGTLSGGQKRRVHTAIALLHRPPLLLLDEATTGADVETRGRVLELVRGLAAEGSAVLYSTHYLQEVEDLRATVVLLDGGRVIARGGADELIAAHAAPVVELAFEGEVPTLAVDGSAIVDGSRVRLPTTDPATTLATVVPGLPPALTARLREGRSCQSPPPVFLTILRTQRVDRSRKKGRGYVSQLTAPRRSGSPPSPPGRWGRTWRRSRSTRCQGQRPNHVALNRRPAEQPSKPHQRHPPSQHHLDHALDVEQGQGHRFAPGHLPAFRRHPWTLPPDGERPRLLLRRQWLGRSPRGE
jgi:ABC-2 type transport system ATP-binding protein